MLYSLNVTSQRVENIARGFIGFKTIILGDPLLLVVLEKKKKCERIRSSRRWTDNDYDDDPLKYS